MTNSDGGVSLWLAVVEQVQPGPVRPTHGRLLRHRQALNATTGVITGNAQNPLLTSTNSDDDVLLPGKLRFAGLKRKG